MHTRENQDSVLGLCWLQNCLLLKYAPDYKHTLSAFFRISYIYSYIMW